MKVLVVLCAVVSAVVAAPSHPIVVPDLPTTHVVHAAPAPVVHAAPAPVVHSPVSSQSHAQDELGQYTYSYSNPLSSKVESKTVDGITRGGYSYLDSHGLVQSVNYVSDDVNGFRVAASNLPLGRVTPQEDEPLVAHEKAKAVAALHQAALHEAAEAAVAHENDVSPVPVAVEVAEGPLVPADGLPPAPVHYSTPAPVHYSTPAPVHYSTPAPVHYSTPAPEVHVTPARVSYVSPAVVHVTPTPHHIPSSTPLPEVFSPSPSPTLITPVDHSYATVELDSHDIPAPAHSPGIYFHPAPPALARAHIPVPVSSTPAPTLYEESLPTAVQFASPSPTPVSYAPSVHDAPLQVVRTHPTPSPLPVYAAPTPVVSTPAPFVHSAPAPVFHATPEPVLHAAPEPVYHVTPKPVLHAAPTAVVHSAPAPVVHTAPAPVLLSAPEPVVHAAPAPVVHAAPAPVVHAPVSSQSHAQDELGQYTYSYSNPLSSKVESKTVDGITRGGYSYLDSHGLVQSVNYVSDDHQGFRVAASNLPQAAVPVEIPDSEDVAAAKAVFFAEIAKAKAAVYH